MADDVLEQIAALKDEDWGIREEAASALGELGDARGVRPLVMALKDADRAVRDAATHALQAIGPPSVPALGQCLMDPDLTVQEAAASVLSSIGDERVVDQLIAALESPDWIVRMYAAKGLGRIGDMRAMEPLFSLLQDKVKAVREESAVALGALGEPAVRALIEMLADSEWLTRLRAVEALGRAKSALALDPLLKLLTDDPDSAVRQDAARSLGEIGDGRAFEPLLQAMDDSRLRAAAVEALGKVGDGRAVEPLRSLVEEAAQSHHEWEVHGCQNERYEQELPAVEAAVKALGTIGDKTAIPTLVTALKSTTVRVEAGDALVRFGQPAIAPLLTVLKHEQDENILFHVRETLSRLGWRAGRL